MTLYGDLLMHFKKTAVIAIMSCALFGCGPKLKIESGTKVSATVWSISDTLMGKTVTLQNDRPGQDALQKINCELAVPTQWDSKLLRHVATKAILACNNQDPIEFPAELIDADGRSGLSGVALGDTITVKLADSVAVKLAR